MLEKIRKKYNNCCILASGAVYDKILEMGWDFSHHYSKEDTLKYKYFVLFDNGTASFFMSYNHSKHNSQYTLIDNLEGTTGTNAHGLDAEYFTRKMKLLIRDISNYTPGEFRQECRNMINALPSEEIDRSEFHSKIWTAHMNVNDPRKELENTTNSIIDKLLKV